MLISVTRLKLSSWTQLMRFLSLSRGSIQQAVDDPNCLAGATYLGAGLTFWTATVWKDESSMRQYVGSGAHRESLPWLSKLCSEGATTHFATEGTTLPSKHDVLRAMTDAPKFFRLSNPTAAHSAQKIPDSSPWFTQAFKSSSGAH